MVDHWAAAARSLDVRSPIAGRRIDPVHTVRCLAPAARIKQARKIMISPVRSEASASAIGLNVTTGRRKHFSMQGCTYRVIPLSGSRKLGQGKTHVPSRRQVIVRPGGNFLAL